MRFTRSEARWRLTLRESLALDGQIEFLPHWTTTHYLGALAVVEHGARHEGTQRCFFVASSGDELAGLAVGRVTAAGAEVLAELESVGGCGCGAAQGDRQTIVRGGDWLGA